MNNRKKHLMGRKRVWMLEMLAGIFIIIVVGFFSIKADMKAAEIHLDEIATYIKNQCHNYSRLNLASESKSLMRIMQSARNIDRQIVLEEKQAENEWSSAELKEYASDNYVTGIVMLDQDGKLQGQYHDGGSENMELEKELKQEAILDTALYPEKTYAMRISCEDGSYIDAAACGRTGNTGIIVAYYRTPTEYVETFFLSVKSLLTGYNIEDDGTIVVADGVKIVASNDESLLGKSTDDIEILKSIREKKKGSSLIQANVSENSVVHDFGLMEHGRDYYIYAFMTERAVFDATPKILLYSLLLYGLVLVVVHMVRWKTAQGYREKQLQFQKEYTDALQNKNEQLKRAVSQADRANAAKTSFLSRMSHDIRTPLNGIIGLLKIDEAHPDDYEMIQANRGKIMIAANHLLELINDILQMSKLESGEIVLARETINLNELAIEIMTIVEQRATEAGIILEYDEKMNKVKYPYVYGSPLHIRQLFLNIYGNCIKYNKAGGKVETVFELENIEDGIVTYRWIISDTGVGMSSEFLKHIFDPFSQERSDARSVYNGTGLGMAIVKGLVDEMNGTIEVTSTIGVGSKFEIVLPFEISKEKIETKKAQVINAGSICNMHLLIAEDNELNAEIAEALLTDEGAEITHACDGQEVIEIFKSEPKGTFDAILMDIMMPHMDGLEATRIIRSLDRDDAKTIPIIAMTANAFDEDARKCIEAGMNAHLSKPLQMEKVIAAISKYCAKNQ